MKAQSGHFQVMFDSAIILRKILRNCTTTRQIDWNEGLFLASTVTDTNSLIFAGTKVIASMRRFVLERATARIGPISPVTYRCMSSLLTTLAVGFIEDSAALLRLILRKILDN